MTGNGGFLVLSTRTGIRPLGLMRRYHSFFCSLVMMFMRVWSHVIPVGLVRDWHDEDRDDTKCCNEWCHSCETTNYLPYLSANSSSIICTFFPFGVLWVMRCSFFEFLTLSGVSGP